MASVVGAVVTVLLAKTLTTAGLGVYSFANAVFGYLAMFFEFGLLVPVARGLPSLGGAAKQRLLGAGVVVMIIIAAAFNVTLLIASFLVDHIFAVQAGNALRVASVVALGWGLTQGCLMLAQGSERLAVYSAANLGSKVLYLTLLVGALAAGLRVTPTAALFVESMTLTVAFLVMMALLRPEFTEVSTHLRRLIREARAYGFAIYVGRVLTSGTYNMDVLLLAWLATPSAVAFYAIAASMAAMVAIPPTGVASAVFGQLARWTEIPTRWLMILGGVSIGAAIAASLGAIPFVHILMGERFIPVIALLPILAMAQAANGFNRILNNFLWAHARGKDLRTAAVLLTVANLVFNLALIPPFGAFGAAWASLGAMVVNLAAHAWGYRRTCKDLRDERARNVDEKSHSAFVE